MHVIRITLHLLIGAWLLAASIAATSLRAAENIRLACVGDSITWGIGAAPGKSYPSQLQALLGPGWQVENFGVSGRTLLRKGDYPYWREQAFRRALAARPDAVVIMLGTNDTKPQNWRFYDEFFTDYRDMARLFLALPEKPRVYVCRPCPVPEPGNFGINEAGVLQEIPLIDRLAREEGVSVIDIHAALAPHPELLPDRVHPNTDGAAIIARIVYGEVMRDTQPAAKSLDPAVNTALIPVPSLERDSYNWWTRHADALAAGPRIQPDIVLLGDSITHFWGGEPHDKSANGPHAWQSTFGTRPVLNLGFGWDRTQNLLWRIDHGEFDGLRPKLVILNIGTNNLSATKNARANTPQEIVAAIAAIRERVRQKCPGAHLIVMGVFPRGPQPNHPFRAPIAAIDALLAKSLAGLPDTTFLDIGARFLAPDGSLPREMMPDGVHPSEAGYAIWSRALVESGLLP